MHMNFGCNILIVIWCGVVHNHVRRPARRFCLLKMCILFFGDKHAPKKTRDVARSSVGLEIVSRCLPNCLT